MTVLYILPNSKPLYINFNKTLLLRSKEYCGFQKRRIADKNVMKKMSEIIL